jgi:hypothetical protein
MEPEVQDFPNDPFDDELDAAVIAAVELVARAKTVGLAELEFPIVDEASVWAISIKQMGISDEM